METDAVEPDKSAIVIGVLIALAMSAIAAIALSIYGVWRIMRSTWGLIVSALAAIVPGGALLFYLVYSRG